MAGGLLFVDPFVEETGSSSVGEGSDVEGVFVGGRVREVIHGRQSRGKRSARRGILAKKTSQHEAAQERSPDVTRLSRRSSHNLRAYFAKEAPGRRLQVLGQQPKSALLVHRSAFPAAV